MAENYIEHFSSSILTKEFLEKYINKQPKWGFNGLGYIVYKRTYSRLLPDEKTTEEWWQTVARSINGAQKIGARYTKEEAERLFDYIFNLKGCFAGRMLWQLGTNVLERFGANSLVNCWYVSIKKIEDFCFLFENLMLGGGVGFSVKREDIYELPRVKKGVQIVHKCTKDADFIVPDSREGWVKLLKNVLTSFFETGESFSYSTILIRGYGELIRGFGGRASGPAILVEGIDKICEILKQREGKKLRSIDVLDICNIIGTIVVSGNVRRSSEISIGDPDDYLFLRAKRWDLGNIPNWRAMSNNTIAADSYEHIQDSVWSGFSGNGEPYGFFNLKLSRKYGRLNEEKKDLTIEGINPCGEIPLASGECCNLSEIFLNNIETKEEFLDLAILLYKTQKAVANMKYIHPRTNEIVQKNMRLGLSVTGICQSLNKLEWCDFVYNELERFDKKWSKELGTPESVRLTTVKPSGTLSLLAGSTPGVHPGFSRYFIRRVRMSSNDDLVKFCRNCGFKVEYVKNFDGTEDRRTVVIEFPSSFPENTIFAENMKAVEQLELIKKMQTIWADNAISCTVYYRVEELPEIKEWLKKNYETSIKSVSFLLHSNHGFLQAPYEKITEENYKYLLNQIKPIHIFNGETNQLESIIEECENGACPIK